MIEALFWGVLSSSSLVLGAAVALRFKISHNLTGLIMAFGVGALISSVCFELVEEAFSESQNLLPVISGLLVGSLAFFAGDWMIDKAGGDERKNRRGVSREPNAGLPILLGTVLDGIPESIVIGMTVVAGGGVSAAMIAAVFLSNIPEALTSSAGLLADGWKKGRVVGLWLAVVAVSALCALIGYAWLAGASGVARAFILSFAGGAILTMLADTMIPEAYRDSGNITGLIVALGFSLTYVVTTME